MKAALQPPAGLVPAAPAAAASATVPGPAAVSTVAPRRLQRAGGEWLARVTWAVGRTGWTGLAGLCLLLAAALFLFSTLLPLTAENEALRSGLPEPGTARARPVVTAAPAGAGAGALPALPRRGDLPRVLRQLLDTAARSRLTLEAGRYEVKEAGGGAVTRYRVTFPVSGPYPRVRAFLDAALTDMPAIALTGLALERRAVSDAEVAAQLQFTVFASGEAPRLRPGAGDPAGMPGPAVAAPELVVPEAAPAGLPGPARVVPPAFAASLFASRSWTVRPPPPPPVKPPPPPPEPAPAAPPLPFAFVGSFAPAGEAPVFFLSRGDRVVDAHVGSRLDGVYLLESASGGQLVFVYLPLDVRQTLSTGGSR